MEQLEKDRNIERQQLADIRGEARALILKWFLQACLIAFFLILALESTAWLWLPAYRAFVAWFFSCCSDVQM